MAIKKTSDYSIFKISPFNAEIRISHIDKIAASISLRNLLERRPILVNSEMEVIDGQHRLKAAERLGVPIYYEIDEKLDENDMALLNTNSRTWKMEDFVKHYASRGFDEYVHLMKFMSQKNLTCMKALYYFGGLGGNSGRGIKNGTWKRSTRHDPEENFEKVQTVISFLKSKMLSKKPFFDGNGIIRALLRLVKTEEYNEEVFLRKIEINYDKIRQCTGAEAYYEMFKEIYNWKNSNPIGE